MLSYIQEVTKPNINIFREHNIEYVRNGVLPSVNIHVDHRSALLGKALYDSDSLIIWRFTCEEVWFSEKYATATCGKPEELRKASKTVNHHEHTNEKFETISKVYWNNLEGLMRMATKLIYDYKNDKSI